MYAVLDGWQCDISSVTERDALPAQAQAFVELVEKEVGVPVKIVGTGAARDAYVTWQ